MATAFDEVEDTTFERREPLPSPLWRLLVGAAALVASAGAFLGDGLGVHLAGYVLSAIVASVAIASYRRRAAQRAIVDGVAPGRAALVAAWALLGLSLLASFGHGAVLAWDLATR